MSDDFFGHNIQFSQAPVDINVEEIMGAGKQKRIPYVDLSGDGHYEEATATTVESMPFSQSTPSKPSNQWRKNWHELVSSLAFGLGGAALVWLAGHLAIASRSGGMDQVRAYHLGSAGNTLPVLALLGGAAAVGIKNKMEQ